jgi:hypothetical protein
MVRAEVKWNRAAFDASDLHRFFHDEKLALANAD